MQSMPLLLRQSLKSPGLSAFSRTTTTTTAANPPITARLRIPSAAPNALTALHAGRRRFSSCRRCQFRLEHGLYSAHDAESGRNHGNDGQPPGGETTGTIAKDIPQEGDVPKPDEAGNAGDPSTGRVNAENVQTQQDVGRNNKEVNDNGNNGGGGGGGGLPSYMENRRSRYSKQFSFMMDNLQSNIFVAGQRLNDLTGYSSIEALKREIQNQEDRLRAARRHVREAKENYTAAINRRSTSQREVNELLQRKHAWSSTDLERFTHLYRNDHTNEVAENEAQMALSMAEREAEEAATKLSKNILSRYHEEQVWSDKIRRMSTWGTWGLMGVNVLLFLVFQIGVEPWRRKRLVKGFEEKVMEALEKEKVSTQEQSAAAAAAAVASATPPSEQASLESSTSDATPVTPTTSDQATSTDEQNIIEYRKSSFSHITPPSTSVESWRQTLNDLLTESTLFIITQRDLTTVAMQSAAAGAAVMGLVIAVIRPR